MGKNTVVILIGGGHCSGKRTVSEKIRSTLKEAIDDVHVQTIPLRSFERKDSYEDSTPQRFDFDLVLEAVRSIEARVGSTKTVIIITGLYALYNKELRTMASMKIFVDCDADTRLNRWITRDVLQEGGELKDVLDTYLRRARPEFNEFIIPTKQFADAILPSEHSTTGISLICDGIVPILTHAEVSSKRQNHILRDHETNLNVSSKEYNGEKSRFYDLS